jgi:hypothetical protein
MGYKDGQGIGMKPGIAKPIEESAQKGKLGLGFKVKNFEEKVESWDFENDEVFLISFYINYFRLKINLRN